jgi:hypothetical protein
MDDTFIMQQDSLGDDDSGGAQPEDPLGGPKGSNLHNYPKSADHGPRAHERPAGPPPRRTKLVLPADIHKVNGAQINTNTRKRDRDMLNR